MKNIKLDGPSVRFLAAAIGLVCASSNLYAQETVENRSVLEEIIVTAQKREQGLQDVPGTVSALSGESLNARGLGGIQDYSNFVPGMIFSGTAFVGERSGPDITVRGVEIGRAHV
jgi:iron complex outermembrane receptor protein